MKKTTVILFICLGCLLCHLSAWAGDLSIPHVTVYGEAEEQVSPDMIAWVLSLSDQGADLKTVAETHARAAADLIAFLKSSGVDADHIQTSGMRFGENRVYRNGTRVKEGYQAVTDIRFTLYDLDRYDYFWLSLAERQGLSIQDVRFGLRDDTAYRQRLQEKALQTARSTAGRMAETLSASIGEPLVVEEPTGGDALPRIAEAQLRAQPAGDGQPSVSPGKLTLRTRLKVVFRLVPPAR